MSSRSFLPWWHAVAFYTAATSAAISAHFLAAALLTHITTVWWLLAFLIGYMLLVFALHRARLSSGFTLIAVAAGAVLSLHLVALHAHHILDATHSIVPSVGWSSVTFPLIIFIGGAVIAHKTRHSWSTVRTLSHPLPTETFLTTRPNIRGIIILLSTPSRMPEIRPSASLNDQSAAPSKEFFLQNRDAIGPPRKLKTVGSVTEALKELEDCDHNWMQLLRSVEPLAQRLEYVWLIGSAPDTQEKPELPEKHANLPNRFGSHCCLPIAQKLLGQLLRPDVKFPETQAVDFQNFDALSGELNNCLGAAKTLGLTPDQLIVDVTGGIKLASIAGAMLTTNLHTPMQYVPSGSGEKSPRIYELRRDELIGPH